MSVDYASQAQVRGGLMNESHTVIEREPYSKSLAAHLQQSGITHEPSELSGQLNKSKDAAPATERLTHGFKLNAPLYQKFRDLGTDVYRQTKKERRDHGKRELQAISDIQRRLEKSNQYKRFR
jgi:hypothetical protein